MRRESGDMNRRRFLAMVVGVPLAAVGAGRWVSRLPVFPQADDVAWGINGGFIVPDEFADAVHRALYYQDRDRIISTFRIPPELIGDQEPSNQGTIERIERVLLNTS